MLAYPRPDSPHVSVPRAEVEGECPACGGDSLERYPVLSEGGWWEVLKCQGCLHSVSRERGSRLGAIHPLSDAV